MLNIQNLLRITPHQDGYVVSLINKNFRDLLNDDLEPYIYPLNEPKYTGLAIFEDLVSFIHSDPTSAFYQRYSINEISEFVRNAGVNPEYLINWVSNWLNTCKINKSIRKAFMSESSKESTKITNKQLKKYYGQLEKYNRPIKQISYFEAEEAYKNGIKNIWAVRSKTGEYECLFYLIGDEQKFNDNHVVRFQYAIDTLCHYYDVREISFEGWLNCDEEHKYATQL